MLDLALGLGRILLELVLDAGSWAYWMRRNRENTIPGVTPATYGRKQRTVTRWLERLGEVQWRLACVALVVLLVVGLYLIP